MAGELLAAASLSETGLEGDRRWALVDGTVHRAGKLFTSTEDKQLMTYSARVKGYGVEVIAPNAAAPSWDAALVSGIARDRGRRCPSGIRPAPTSMTHRC